MEIKQEEMLEYIKILKKVNYNPVKKGKAVIFFPVESSSVVQTSGTMMLLEKKETGSAVYTRFGLVLESDGLNKDTIVAVGYATIEYSVKIKFEEYIDIFGANGLSKKERAKLNGITALLVRDESLLSEYSLDVK